MPGLKGQEVLVLFLSIAVILAVARAFGEIARKLNQPIVLGELLAGIVLGPSLLGHVAPNITEFLFPATGSVANVLGGLRTVGIVLFLLVAGMEVELSTMWRQGKTALSVGLAGIAFPFSLGLLCAWLAPGLLGREPNVDHFLFALFIGTAMSISALPLIARTLMDLKLYRSEFGMIVIAAAVFDDIVGWIMFATILSMMGHDSGGLLSVGRTLVGVILFAGAILTVGRWLIHRALPWVQAHTTWPVGVLSFALSLACFGAALSQWIGIHAIFGSFLVGVAIGDSVHLKEYTRKIMAEAVSFFFAPLFFAGIGLYVNFYTNFDWLLTLLVFGIACVGKVIACGIGAWWGGLPRREAAAVGMAMNARGAMEIILGLLALQAGIIGQRLFVSLVTMALVTSVISGPLIRWALKLAHRKKLATYLSSKAFVKPLRATDRRSAIRELSTAVAKACGGNEFEIAARVLKRESIMPTGIGNGIAIPHARMDGLTTPIIGVGISEQGIEFDAPDGAPARIVFLIIAPSQDDGSQLAVLSEIGRVFGNTEARNAAILASSFTEFLAVLKVHDAESGHEKPSGHPSGTPQEALPNWQRSRSTEVEMTASKAPKG